MIINPIHIEKMLFQIMLVSGKICIWVRDERFDFLELFALILPEIAFFEKEILAALFDEGVVYYFNKAKYILVIYNFILYFKLNK